MTHHQWLRSLADNRHAQVVAARQCGLFAGYVQTSSACNVPGQPAVSEKDALHSREWEITSNKAALIKQ